MDDTSLATFCQRYTIAKRTRKGQLPATQRQLHSSPRQVHPNDYPNRYRDSHTDDSQASQAMKSKGVKQAGQYPASRTDDLAPAPR